jgi:endonuclease-3
MKPADVHTLFATFKAANPAPKTELEYSSPFELLIAVLLSAQATDVSVNKATRGLFKRANTPQKMLALGEDALGEQIKTIGLYRSKAKHALATCRILVEQHSGAVPRSREALEALPGVGRKTANVVLNTAFGEPTIAVDTHIFRVSTGEGGAGRVQTGRTPLADSAWPLCVQGAQARVLALRRSGALPFQTQDAGAKRIGRSS